MHALIQVVVLTAVWTIVLVVILRGKHFRRSKSLAIFTIHKEADKQKQIKNFFRNDIKFGITTVVLVVIEMVVFLTPLFFTSLPGKLRSWPHLRRCLQVPSFAIFCAADRPLKFA